MQIFYVNYVGWKRELHTPFHLEISRKKPTQRVCIFITDVVTHLYYIIPHHNFSLADL